MGFTNQAVSIVIEDQAGYTNLQRELDGYDQLENGKLPSSQPPEYLEVVDPITTPIRRLTKQAALMETGSESGYTLPCRESNIYEEVPDSVIKMDDVPEYFLAQSQFQKYDNVVDVEAKPRPDSEMESYLEI